MKGVLKGLRYISQIFDEEKEEAFVIGFPTDVKHVAHIGMDGPSNAPPTWMNDYKQPDGDKEEADKTSEGGSVHKSENGSLHKEGSRRGSKANNYQDSPARELPEVPKPSRRNHSSLKSTDSPKKAKSEKHRHSRRASKESPGRDFLDSGRLQSDAESESGVDSPRKRPDIPKTRRKKSKDSEGSGRRSKGSSEEADTVPRHRRRSSGSIKSVEGDSKEGLSTVL